MDDPTGPLDARTCDPADEGCPSFEDELHAEHCMLLHEAQRLIEASGPDPLAARNLAATRLPAHGPLTYAGLAPALASAAAWHLLDDVLAHWPLATLAWRHAARPVAVGAACGCGIGHPVATCPGRRAQSIAVDAGWLWDIHAAFASNATLRHAARDPALPLAAVPALARAMVAGERWLDLRRLLEARLRDGDAVAGDALAELLEPLLDAFDRLADGARRKRSLLLGLAEHPSSALRARALLAMAVVHADHADEDAALAAMAASLRAAPDSTAAAGFEIRLLVRRGDWARVRDRAAFWQARFERNPHVEPELAAWFGDLRRDGADTLTAPHLRLFAPAAARLCAWLDAHPTRALPNLVTTPHPGGTPGDHVLRSGLPQQRMTSQWLTAVRTRESGGVAGHASRIDTRWAWTHASPWQEWLERHPMALDIPLILLHLRQLLANIAPDLDAAPHRWIDAIDRRAAAIAARIPPGVRLPAAHAANRPLLELLAFGCHAIGGQAAGATGERRARLERLVSLAADHAPWARRDLVECLLLEGDDHAVLAHSAGAPWCDAGTGTPAGAWDGATDPDPATAHARVLALYRLGDRPRAAAELECAARHWPFVLEALACRRPVGGGGGRGLPWIGRDAALAYCQRMRPLWAATPGAIAWLRPYARQWPPSAEQRRQDRYFRSLPGQ